MTTCSEKERLHTALEELTAGSRADQGARRLRMIGHALIELGLLEKLECSWEHCKYDSRQFVRTEASSGESRLRSTRKLAPSVDHIIGLMFGGSDRPENLRLVHLGCNSAKAMRDIRELRDTDERAYDSSQRRIEAIRRRWRDPIHLQKITESNNSAEGASRAIAKSDAMRRWWASEAGQKHRAKQRGEI